MAARKPPPHELVKATRDDANAYKGRADPVRVLRANREQVIRLAQGKGVGRMREVLKRAEKALASRLGSGPLAGGKEGFSAVQRRLALAQIRAVVGDVGDGVKDVVVDGAGPLAEDAGAGVIDYMRASDRKFRGIVERLPIREAAVLDRATQGAESSVLHRLMGDPRKGPGILKRYGDGVVERFEQALQQRFLQKTSWEDTRAAIVAESPFLQGVPGHWAERIVRTECLVGETPVSGAVVRAAFRRWYEGPIVEFITDNGRHFATTPNHPMLTRRGWVAAAALNDGDDLVCYRGQQHARAPGDEHREHAPSTVAQIFDSLTEIRVLQRRRGSKDDFHGDGMQREIEIASADRELEVGVYAPLFKPLCDQILTPTHATRPAFCRNCGRLLSIDEQACFCRAPNLYSLHTQTVEHAAFIDAELASETLDALAGDVAFRNRLRGHLAAEPGWHSAPGMKRKASRRSGAGLSDLAQMLAQSVDVGSGSGGRVAGARACDVEFDGVVEVRMREFRGHVYNLTTWDGYFCIAGAYTGNTMGVYNRASLDASRELDDQLGDVVKILCATFDGRTAWDSYLVHGQIRRVDEPFECPEYNGSVHRYMHPPNRPNDREVVVTHRVAWPIPPELRPRPRSEAASRWADAGYSRAMPATPRQTTVPLERFGRVA